MTRHTIAAEFTVLFTPVSLTEVENATIKAEIDYFYELGDGSSWSDPGHGAELSVLDARLIDGDGIDPDRATLLDWCQTWIEDEGYDRACREAEDDREPDPDAAYEAMRDRRDER